MGKGGGLFFSGFKAAPFFCFPAGSELQEAFENGSLRVPAAGWVEVFGWELGLLYLSFLERP